MVKRILWRLIIIKLPEYDDNGKALPHDHPEIEGNDEIIRRISEQLIVTIDGERRISSKAFKASSGENGGMSIDLKVLIENDGIDPREYVTNPRWTGSLIFKVSDLRNINLQIGYDPLPDNKYHGEVWGNFTRGVQNQLRELAAWFVPITGVNIEK